MGRLFAGKTVKARLVCYNMLVVGVIAVIFSASNYLMTNRRLMQLAVSGLENHVQTLSDHYRLAYEEMVNIVINCTDRKAFDLAALGSLRTPAQRRQGLRDAELANNFCAITGYGGYISRFTVFNERAVIQAGTGMGSVDDQERILSSRWFEAELAKTIDSYPLDYVVSPFFRDESGILPIAREISEYSVKEDGWVLLCISPQLFGDALKEYDSKRETLVVTHTGQRIASRYEDGHNRRENDGLVSELLAREADSGIVKQRVHGKDSLVAYSRAERSGVMVVEILPLDLLRGDKRMLMQTVLMVSLACVVIGLALSMIVTEQIQKPVKRLVDHIGKLASGNLVQDPTIESEDEIGAIGKVINDMTGQISGLLEQKVKDEREKSSLEIKMLQAQINPHFLYNTLDSIKWIAVIQKNSGIVKAVTALSGLLRNMAKGFDEKVTLKKELDFLNDYVVIEKLKYVELFDVDVQVEDEALYRARVIKLTLQPLVENAIFSGIEPSGHNGRILIRAYELDGEFFIEVEDDGVGIPEEKLAHILENTEQVKGDRMSSIGLANVDRRIKLNYGPDYGLSVESEVGRFTRITVHMPLEFEEEM